eukprot:1147762-Pelagomonas_calceolata.AAC.2
MYNPARLQLCQKPNGSYSVGNHYTLNTMHARMPGFQKCQRLPSNKQQISRNPTNPHMCNQEELIPPNQLNPTLMLKVPDWRIWAYTDGSCHILSGKQETGAGVYCLSPTAQNVLSQMVLDLPTPYVEMN